MEVFKHDIKICQKIKGTANKNKKGKKNATCKHSLIHETLANWDIA